MLRIQEMTNTLVKGIKFTVDLPEKYDTEKVPMLDIAVWMETDGDGVKKIRHKYYEKTNNKSTGLPRERSMFD